MLFIYKGGIIKTVDGALVATLSDKLCACHRDEIGHMLAGSPQALHALESALNGDMLSSTVRDNAVAAVSISTNKKRWGQA